MKVCDIRQIDQLCKGWLRIVPVCAVVLGVGLAAQAQSVNLETGADRHLIQADGGPVNEGTVKLLHGLAEIESDVRLVILFAVDHVNDPTGSHGSDPLTKVWPEYGAALLAAGVEDFEPILRQLAEAGDEKTVIAVSGDVLKAIVRARSTLQPSYDDIGASVLELSREAMAKINSAGPTPLADYQDAWSLLSVARSEVDLLVRATDPVKAKAAVKMVLALDDVILFMPDPAATGPVAFDPAVLAKAVGELEILLDGEV